MPLPNDYKEILSSLLERTTKGEVNWDRDDLTNGVSLIFGDSKMVFWSGTDEHTDQPYIAFSMRKHRSSSLEPALDSWYVDFDDRDYERASQVFDAAKRHINRIPERLKHLQDLLSMPGKVGDEEL